MIVECSSPADFGVTDTGVAGLPEAAVGVCAAAEAAAPLVVVGETELGDCGALMTGFGCGGGGLGAKNFTQRRIITIESSEAPRIRNSGVSLSIFCGKL